MHSPLTRDYIGFSGHIHFPVRDLTCQCILDVPGFSVEGYDHLVQLLSPHSASALPSDQPQPFPPATLLLAGIQVASDPLRQFVEHVVQALQQGDYTNLLIEDYCGCLVTKEAIWLWKTRASNDTIFYRRSGESLCWSTDLRTLATEKDLSHNGLAQCCLGNDVFVYPGIEYVAAGTIVRCSATRTHTTTFDQIVPRWRPTPITLPELAVETRSVLTEVTRPLAQTRKKIGILLSGGIDSATVAASLAHHGADVIAYHLQFGHSAASEVAYAQAVCQALSLPLVIIPATTGRDYLSFNCRFPHPYGHAGLRWMQLIAEQASRDGVSLLTTGRGGDPAFGPLRSYGLSDICSAPIAVSEKLAMVAGAISTDWLLPDIIRSLRRSHSLINERSLSASLQEHFQPPPFLCQRFLQPLLQEPYDQTGFSPHDLVLETAVWQPHGLRVVHPFHHQVVQQVAGSIPVAYRLIPYRGMRVVKPVLRLAFADMLPPLILRQKRGGWLSVPSQEYCLKQRRELLSLLGDERTQLAMCGILVPKAIREVLSSQILTRKYAKELIATAMTELFLRQGVCSSDSSGKGA